MILHIAADGAVLNDPANFRALAVSTALDASQLRTAVIAQRVGVVDADEAHVWLEPDALRAAAGPAASTAEWADGLVAMLGYASGHGWTDDQGRVRAHIEAPA